MILKEAVQDLAQVPAKIACRYLRQGIVSVNGKTACEVFQELNDGDTVEVGNSAVPFHFRGVIEGKKLKVLAPPADKDGMTDTKAP